MARRIVSRPRSSGTRRTSEWFGLGISVTTLATDDTLIATLNATALLARPFTIVRTRLSVFLASDQTAAQEFTQGVFTMQVVTDSASAAGVDSVPNGVDETNADFFVYQPMFTDITSLTSVGIIEYQGPTIQYEIDSKAMRKVGADDDVAVVMAIRSPLGVDIALEGRMLVKPH